MEYKAMGLTDFGSNRVFDDLYGTHAHHRMNGVFALRGPGVRQGERVEGARLVDLAPTIYALMGIPIPRDLDGQVLEQAFAPDSAPNSCYEEEHADHFQAAPEQAYTPEEEAQVMEQLRNLGYVD
jgi:arylsulfatase A-like enzyme